MLSKTYISLLIILATTQFNAQSWEQINKIVAHDRGINQLFGYDVSVSEGTIFVGAILNDTDSNDQNLLENSGSTYVYTKDISGNWIEVQKLTASDRDNNDYFGSSVAVYEDRAIVSAFNRTVPAIYFFKRNTNGVWIQEDMLEDPEGNEDSLFGTNIAIYGTTAIVGAPYEDEDENGQNELSRAGAVYIYTTSGNGDWTLSQKIDAQDRSEDMEFGATVAIHNDLLAVGATKDDTTLQDAGAVYIFEEIAGTWNQSLKITPSDLAEDDQFGNSIDLYENDLIVGAVENTTSQPLQGVGGTAYMYNIDVPNNTATEQILSYLDEEPGDSFGFSVAISDTYAVVSAIKEDEDSNGNNTLLDSGSSYIFKKDSNGVWLQEDKIVATDRESQDRFGMAISMDGAVIVIGVEREDEDENGGNSFDLSGSGYIFENDNILHTLNQTVIVAPILYPNPASSIISIVSEKPIDSISLYDLQGKKILEQKNNSQLDISALSRGTYTIVIMSGINSTTHRIMVD